MCYPPTLMVHVESVEKINLWLTKKKWKTNGRDGSDGDRTLDLMINSKKNGIFHHRPVCYPSFWARVCYPLYDLSSPVTYGTNWKYFTIILWLTTNKSEKKQSRTVPEGIEPAILWWPVKNGTFPFIKGCVISHLGKGCGIPYTVCYPPSLMVAHWNFL